MVNDWFYRWLEFHQRLHPHRSWVRAESSDAPEFYQGWIEALARMGATEDLARQASKDLQAGDPGFPNKHLGAIQSAIRNLRRTVTAGHAAPVVSPEQQRCAALSAGCPECDGTGWARRRVLFDNLAAFGPSMVDMFCRCPLGRWRTRTDPDLTREPFHRCYDDLQAHPDLWDPALSFPVWSEVVCLHDLEDDGIGGPYRYLKPGEECEKTFRPREDARSFLKKVKDATPQTVPEGVETQGVKP